MENTSALYSYVAAALVAVVFYRWRFVNLYDIPSIGPSFPIVSYLGAYRFMRDNKNMIQEGYQKFKGKVFKVAMLDRWLVVISGPKLIEEVRKLPDDQASFGQGLNTFVQFHHSFGNPVIEDPIQVSIIHDQLTRHLSSLFDDIKDEIILSCNDFIPCSNEWTPVNVLLAAQTIVARASSRVFVGIPLCRNKTYLDISVNQTISIVETRQVLSFFPDTLKPIIAQFLTGDAKRANREAKKLLAPLIQERLDEMEKLGEGWTDKPDDMLQWLIDTALSKGKTLDEMVLYMMLINFASIHTTSNTFAHALFDLAANPEYVQPLREEIELAIGEEGWSRAAMQKLKKIDSFFRESLRFNGVDSLSLTRKIVKDITLSDGTFIPAGMLLVAASGSTHMDPDNYADPTLFNPWRFSDLREKEGGNNRHQFVSTSVDYIAFGHGKHACPGRFFAATELKCLLAHVIMNYDVRCEVEGVRPENIWAANAILADPAAKVLFRKRVD